MKFEDKYIEMTLVDGIVYARYKPNVFIDTATAKAIVAARNKLANNLPHTVLVEGGPIDISADARKYALTKESSENIIAWAIVNKLSMFKSVFMKLLFFTQGKWNKIRFFDDREEAIKWLKRMAAEHQPIHFWH